MFNPVHFVVDGFERMEKTWMRVMEGFYFFYFFEMSDEEERDCQSQNCCEREDNDERSGE